MKLSIFLLIFATAVAIPPSRSSQLSNVEIEGRITRANNASEGQFPYQVGLLQNDSNQKATWCGGTLINIGWVLTAAHCLVGISTATVFLGSTVRQQAEEIRFASKKDFIIHHGYNSKIFEHDIALIKISPVALSPKIQTIKLPSIMDLKHSTYANKLAIASGWGRISDADPYVTNHLQWARLRIIPAKVCTTTYSASPKSPLCVASVNGISPCNGDSGGPLVLEEDGTLVGSFSYLAMIGCELDMPVAYVPLTNYLDWIYKHTGIFY